MISLDWNSLQGHKYYTCEHGGRLFLFFDDDDHSTKIIYQINGVIIISTTVLFN